MERHDYPVGQSYVADELPIDDDLAPSVVRLQRPDWADFLDWPHGRSSGGSGSSGCAAGRRSLHRPRVREHDRRMLPIGTR